MARVSVKMFATVREAAGAPSAQLVASDTEELFSKLKDSFGPKLSRLLDEAISDPERLVILLNGKNLVRSRDRPLRLADGDEIAIFPPVSGG
jgi:MoaD family protein